MRILFSLFAFLISLNSFAEPANILYYKFGGEYLSEKSYAIELDLERDSIKSIKELLQSERARDPACSCAVCKVSGNGMNADLVIIGRGEDGPMNFFAATANLDQETPLARVGLAVPSAQRGKAWNFYFLDSEISHYVTEPKSVHSTCPFKGLTQIGQQKLQYFQ